MNEDEYIKSIDASFPYHDEHEWKAVIKEGVNISDNAAYMALYEICSGVSDAPKSDLLKMLEYWSSIYDHPTKAIVMEAAKAVINREILSERKRLDYLDIVSNYPGFYNAVNIICCAGDGDWDENETILKKYNEVINKWKNPQT